MKKTLTIECDGNDPYESKDFLIYAKADKMASALFEIDNNLGKEIKYWEEAKASEGEEVTTEDVKKKIFKEIHSILEEHHIDTDELI